MLTLNDGRKEMYQWDIGRIATVDVECNFVHFSNLKYGGSLSVEVKNGVVAIPNKLLTSGEPIYCWAFVADENGNYTKQEQTLNVNKRAKPSDYVYTETETLTWKSLDERITELEKGGTGGGSGDMQKSVYDPNNNAKDIFKYADDAAKKEVANHTSSGDAHSDIRTLITGLTNRLNALADSDDTTLDQMSEIVAYIKSNKSLIDAITTSKVSVSDIVDNLTSSATNKPLSAAQGKALKALIDAIVIPDKLPNPNALTFSGAVTGRYDGSSPMTVNIPSGGGSGGTDISLGITGATVGQTVKIKAVNKNGIPTEWEAADAASGGSGDKEWKLLRTVALPVDPSNDTSDITYYMCSSEGYTDQIANFKFSTDNDGKPFAVRELFILAYTGWGRAENYFGVSDQSGNFGYGNLACSRNMFTNTLTNIAIRIFTVGDWSVSEITKNNNLSGKMTGNLLNRSDTDITTIKFGTFADCSIKPGSTFEFWGR